MPKPVAATMARSLRAGKVLVDWSQHNGSKTTVAPYSLRGRDQPTVAAPRTWDEIADPKLRQLRYDEVQEVAGGIGSLMMGIPTTDGLHFAGRVGTGFTERDLANPKETLAPLHSGESPFDTALARRDATGVTLVKPTLVGEARYSEWTSDGRLRQPRWRGLRPDKEPSEVVRE